MFLNLNSVRISFSIAALLVICGFAKGDQIHELVRRGDMAALNNLLSSSPSLSNQEDEFGSSPLDIGAFYGRLDACKELVKAGAKLNHLDKTGNSPLVKAVNSKHPEVVKYLLDMGAKFDIRDRDGNTSLMWAAMSGSVDCMKVLLEKGADLNTQDTSGRTPLHHASYQDRREMVTFLLGKKCDPNAKAKFDVTPLHWAVEHNLPEVAKLLISHGANLECRRTEDAHLMTPLMHASRDGALECVEILIASGANVEARDTNGFRALHYASKSGRASIVRSLLKAKAVPNELVIPSNFSPLHFAADSGDLDVMKILIEFGAKIDSRNSEGNTPLADAALLNHVDQVAYLVSKGANVNSQGIKNSNWPDNNAETVIHFAIRSGNDQILNLILQAGGDPTVKDGAGDDALAYALKKSQQGLANLIRKALTVRASGTATQPLSETGPSSRTKSRNRLSRAFGVDSLAVPGFSPTYDGRLQVSARNSRITMPTATVVEFAPVCDRADLSLVEIAMVINGKPERTRFIGSSSRLPIFTYETSQIVGEMSRIQLVGIDGHRKQIELLRAEIRTTVPDDSKAVKLQLAKEKISLNNPGITSKVLDVFTDGIFVGRILDPSNFSVDARQLSPGQHTIWVISSGADGEVPAPSRSLVDIRSRFKASSEFDHGTFVVEGIKTSMPIHISVEPDTDIASFRIYLGGSMVFESNKSSVDANISMLDAPTGQVILEIIGIGKDGETYAPETLTINVKSPYFDSLLAKDRRAKQLQLMCKQMTEFDQDVVYWYERAVSEPKFKTYMFGRIIFASDAFGRMASIGYIDSITVPGNTSKYLAECKAAIVRRAQHRLEIGKLQKALGMRERAISTLQQVISEVGRESGIGLIAEQELRGA